MRNRIVELKWVKASELQQNPNNWRLHPDNQRRAVEGSLNEIGWYDIIIFNQRTGNIVDGNLRQDIAGDEMVPLLVVDLNESEERKALATHDPLTAMAGIDAYKLDELLRDLETDSADLQAMLDDMQADVQSMMANLHYDSPEAFREYDEDIETEHRCPKCGYEWSGSAS